ncbi:profilin-like [Teleopsis dalmanni]|uniref:profilin-like n=1 Tax=Teleopsis dalmanni TaxID=139649 RepID=UPI0018CD56FC|nr:profilin-like [Teleopsis dalmanni]
MSWQEYMDNHLLSSKCIDKACIAGLDGNVWAQSKDFAVTKDELSMLISGFENMNVLVNNGVNLAGQRFIYISGSDSIVRARLGKDGVHCMKTKQAVIVSTYNDPIQPQQVAMVVEKLGEHLLNCDY